ncbi:hypothetical protein DFH11DRAFT_1622820 [Phellopilus nigrolimitatus]|nr:hypothetical protein DFH11DRAFT_1622820 [Phellopilus nigrolimitatus]
MASSNATVPVPPTPASLHIHLDNSLGAAFIGLIVAAILFGVTNIQALMYYQNYGRDPRYMKWAIGFLWLLDALHLALISHVLYFYLVTNFTNLLIITDPTWSLCLHVAVTTVSDFIVRSYYTRRVWMLSKKNWFLTLGCATFTFVTFVSGMGFCIKIFSYTSTLQFTQISWVLYTSLGSGVAADLWVAISLCYFLMKNRTGFKSTDTKISILMVYIINTGLLTSMCAVCCFVSFAVMPHNYIFIGFYFSLSKLYFNSLLATLNARDKLRDSLDKQSHHMGASAYQMPRFVSVGTPSASKQAATSFGTVSASQTSPTHGQFGFMEKEDHALAVNVRTEMDYHTDDTGIDTKSGRLTSVLPL